MKSQLLYLLLVFFPVVFINAQDQKPAVARGVEMLFVSDTQQPLWFEKILHKSNHNLTATADIFADILNKRPGHLYMLGDVVGLGCSNKKWKKVDRFLDSCQRAGTVVCGLLGNHELLFCRKKGEKNFDKRFPISVPTGYVSICDSVAVILLNSNFNALSAADLNKERSWYQDILTTLDKTDSIKVVIITCHHAPYSNSKTVGGSLKVQEYFVPGYIKSKKAQAFLTGHSHAFEHFKIMGKDFVVIGGGGGLQQPLCNSTKDMPDLAADYKPMFHYLCVQRVGDSLLMTSHFLKNNFSGFGIGHSFITQPANHSPL